MLTLFLYTSASSFRSRKFSCLCTSNVLFDKCVFCTMSQIYNIEYSNIIRASWETGTFALKEFTWITNKLTNISRGGWELLLCATNGCISLFFTNLLTSIESRNESLKHSRRWNCCVLDVIMHNFPMKISYRIQTSHPSTSHLFKVFSSMLFPKSTPASSQTRPYNLNSPAVSIPFYRLTLTQQSFYPYSSSFWNSLPQVIVNAITLQSFKSAVQAHLL